MKKTTIILLVIFLLVLSIAISYVVLDIVNNLDNTAQVANNEEQVVDNEIKNEIDQTARIEELEARLKGNLPIMDGSTSTIPIEGGIIAAFEGITQEEAEAKVQHATTYGSFD